MGVLKRVSCGPLVPLSLADVAAAVVLVASVLVGAVVLLLALVATGAGVEPVDDVALMDMWTSQEEEEARSVVAATARLCRGNMSCCKDLPVFWRALAAGFRRRRREPEPFPVDGKM